ncbi:MAG: glycosyltransferase [Lachnospiraceae bacterium]|nr:glycosyltransferase [Lachnospiraceae bacterium]
MKRILILLNYYYPYISGISEYARILAEGLVERGYQVTVVTSEHVPLKRKENINGVDVLRSPVLFRISKGTVSPAFLFRAIGMAGRADVVIMHLPMIESGLISTFVSGRKLIAMYHCDVNLPETMINKLIVKCMDISNRICLKRSRFVAVQTSDYAEHSRVAFRYREKYIEAAAPVKDYHRREPERRGGKKRIGFCGRLVEEKGIHVLLKAFEILLRIREDITLVIGGDYENVAGGSVYPELMNYIKEKKIPEISFPGKIAEEKMEEFYSSLDVFVLPSVNSLEAFGMVQIEAMFCGTPVIATDLYGVRTIVQKTGMGRVVKRNDPESLAHGIGEVLDHPEKYRRTKEEIQKYYGTKKCVSVFQKAVDECC